MLPSDRNKGSKKKTSTFLGVDPGTLTIPQIQQQSDKAKAAAAQRAPIVNEAIEEQNKVLNGILYYPRAAEQAWQTGADQATSAKIIESIRNTSVGQKLTIPESFNYRYTGGQFTGVGKQTQDFREFLRPKTFTELAEVAAKRDTTNDATLQHYYASETIDQKEHDEILKWGEDLLSDNEAALDWVLAAPTPEEQRRRMERVTQYVDNMTKTVDIFDGVSVLPAEQLSESAVLPPWVQSTMENLNKWDYYKTYLHGVTQAQVDAYNKYNEEAKRKKENPYVSAFSSEHDPNSIDSFLDIIIKSVGTDGFDASYERLLNNTITYFRDYIINPMKHGPKGMLTAAGNALWNMMDTMDVASRGVRAFVAGDMVLGGSGGKEFKTLNSDFDDYYAKTWEKYGVEPSEEYKRNQYHGKWERINDAKFEGQNVYWVDLEGHTKEESMKAQQLFMDNGGYELLLSRNPEFATKGQLGKGMAASASDAKFAKIARGLDEVFKDTGINWRDIYRDINDNYFVKDRAKQDVAQAVENVKQTYTTPEASFNADTGNLAADIVIESVLDPGLIVGGLAKNLASNTVESVTDNAVRQGFLSIFKNSDDVADFMNNKEVRRAVKDIVRMNDGKNIIFKKAEALDGDLDVLIAKFRDTGIFDSAKTAFDTADDAAEYFKRTVSGHLMGKNISVNGKILASTDFARRALDEKTFKAAYFMDKAIDGIDSAIVKSSFALPWGSYKALKAGIPAVMNTSVIRNVASRRILRLGQAASDRIDETTGAVNVMNINKVAKKLERGIVKEREWKFTLQTVVDEYDEVARSINGTIRDFSTGSITADDAIRQVREYISNITGGKYKDIRQLEAYVNRIDVRYAGDIKQAFDRINRTYNRLTEAINKGYDKIASERLQKSAIDAGIQGVQGASKKTIHRVITYDKFMKALSDVGIDLNSSGKQYEKLASFVKEWQVDPYVRYNTADVLKEIDKASRSAYFSKLLNVKEFSEAAALNANAILGEFNALRRQVKHMDMLSLKHGDYVYLMHTDRMALHTELMNSPQVQDMYKTVDEQVVQVILKEFKGLTTENMDLATSQLAQTLQQLSEMKYGFDRTNILIDEIKNLPGFNDEKLNTVLNGVANNFGFHGDLEDLLSNPNLLKKHLETTLRTRAGDSKLSRSAMAEALRGLSSGNPPEFMKRYSEEMADPAVKQTLDKYINKAVSDPTSYVETQMLYTALADPSVITEWDALARAGQAPIGFHVNSTGLSSEINNITSISLRKWVPLDLQEGETLSLKRLLEAFDQGETEVIGRRGISIKDDEFTESVLRRMDMKNATKKQMLDAFRKTHDANLKVAFDSEEDVIREVCKYFKDNSIIMKDGAPLLQAPSLIVHDLDGFNIPYFTNKVGALRRNIDDEADAVVNYFDNLSYRMSENQINTYARLSEQVGDFSYSEDQIQEVLRLMQDYADDLNHYGQSYKFMDTYSYANTLDSLENSIDLNIKAGKATEAEKRFDALYNQAEASMLTAEYNRAVADIEKLTLQPRGYAFVMNGTEVNPVHAALKAAGRDTVNVESRIYVDDVLAHFDLDIDDGFVVSVEDLKKMHDLSSYVVRKHEREIVDGAEEFLRPYKARFDQMIQSMRDLAMSDGWDSTQLAYIQNIRIPDNAVDSYLIAKKLYQDHMRYWLDSALDSGLSRDGHNLDDFKAYVQQVRKQTEPDDIRRAVAFDKLFQQACEYDKSYRRRFFDELTTGGFSAVDNQSDDVLALLEGANQPQIFKKAARSDYEKKLLRYENDVLKDGIDAARKCSEAGSEMKSNLRQLNHIDSMMNAMGASRSDTILLGATHQKAATLFDVIKDSGLAERPSFRNFVERVSELRHIQLQQANLDKFKVNKEFNREALLSELLHNGFNMSVFNSHSYTVTDMRNLKKFVRKLRREGDDFISIFEDRSTGNIFVYLNDKAIISEAGDVRYINNKYGFKRPEIREAIAFPEFDELSNYVDLDDLEDFRGVYDQLVSCWDDTRMLSRGSINGTSGRTVSMAQAEEFIKTLPDELSDWCTSEGLLRSEISRGVIYDPGFVRNDAPDVLFDFMDTLHAQANVAKEDTMLANMVFNRNESLQFNELAENFTDDELISYFGDNSDYVVCTLIADPKTATGFRVRQLNLNNLASLDAAKSYPNTTILPYDAFHEIANTMNRDVTDNVYRKMISKYMQLYKAFALMKPGTWMRNYIDATTKAGIDNGEGMTGVASMLQYEGKAVRDISAYYRIAKADPSLLNKANWDVLQKSFKTDMTYEDFELLRGVLDGSTHYTADKKYLKRTMNRRGQNVISGKDIGLRNLDEKDFKSAFKKYMSNEMDLPLSKKEFEDIYFHRVKPDEKTNELYEDMFRKFSNNLRHADATNIYDKTVNAMFRPFGSVENVVRYAQTAYLRDMGFSDNQIMRHIHATQFYTAPSWTTLNRLETILPFITFKYNNAMYWIKMMDENPRFFRYFEDLYGNIARETIESMQQQGQDIDYAEDYALRSGAIPIGGGKAYLNMNNSFLGAMNDFYGIVNTVDDINPLFKDTVRSSLYALGFESNNFFEGVDLDPTDEDMTQKLINAVPGGSLTRSAYRTFQNISDVSTETGGPNMDAIYSALNFLGVLGVRKNYKKDASFDFDAWQAELEAQGSWYDCNLGKIVDISEKNEYGANDPNNSFQDVQSYMLTHFGKLWDANQHKFVTFDEYQEGGLNDGFDFENDENAWEKLCAYQASQGKIYDFNQRKFVLKKDYISGGLNDPDIDWETKVMLMEEKFPNLKWDQNQQAFVEADKYIAGGLNDTETFYEVMALRRALYGEEYNRDTHKFEKTSEPTVVLLSNVLGIDRYSDKYDKYYAMLGLTKLTEISGNVFFNDEGLLVNDKGQYVITGNAEYDQQVFDKAKELASTYGYGGRRYSRWKNYSYSKIRKAPKPYKGRTLPTSYYTHYGYESSGASENYSFQFQYNYKYHSPQPGRKLHMLAAPRINYPYGGGYNKYSFYRR